MQNKFGTMSDKSTNPKCTDCGSKRKLVSWLNNEDWEIVAFPNRGTLV